MNNARNIECLAIDEIVVPEGRRQPQEDKVKELAHSIELIGLQQPIKVRMQADKPHLIDGLHRLGAVRALGWPKIDCEIVEADDRRARMMEIAANLHRAELSELERAEAIIEWVRLAKEERERLSAQLAQKVGLGRPEGGQSQAARELGVPRDAIRRAQKIEALPEGAKAAARDLQLADNQAALLEAAKSENPLAALQEHASRSRYAPEAETARRALRANALDRVATMLIERLGDEIAGIVPDLEAITAHALASEIRRRCPKLFEPPKERAEEIAASPARTERAPLANPALLPSIDSASASGSSVPKTDNAIPIRPHEQTERLQQSETVDLPTDLLEDAYQAILDDERAGVLDWVMRRLPQGERPTHPSGFLARYLDATVGAQQAFRSRRVAEPVPRAA